MSRRLIVFVTAMCAACAQPTERTIAYLGNRPIAERLLPGDTKVVVQMKIPEVKESSRPESFEQEIQRLKKSEIIAVVRVTHAESEIADRGTWIRTKVDATVDRVVQAPARSELGESLEFTFGGGSTLIGAVEVSTGLYPRFVDGGQYLVVLQTRRGTASSLTWTGTAFRVDTQGALQRVGISDGSEQTFRTNLVGRSLSEVSDALAR